MKETITETRIISFDSEKMEVSDVENVEVRREPVNPESYAKCDLCYCNVAKFKDLEEGDSHMCSPEMFSKAVRSGMEPPKSLFGRIGGNREIRRKIIRNWRQMAVSSETPWCLCEQCMNIVKRYTV